MLNPLRARIVKNAAIGEIPRAQRRPLAKPLNYYQIKHRDPKTAMVGAYATGDYTMQAIADFFGVHYATISRAVNQEGSGDV